MLTLDAHHGHEWPDGSYHYHGTESYPYLIASMRGSVTLEGSAPQSQIGPQPRAEPPRQGDPHAVPDMNDASFRVTGLTMNSTGNGYTIAYSVLGGSGAIEYSWDDAGLFTFVYSEPNGVSDTETWQGTGCRGRCVPVVDYGNERDGHDVGRHQCCIYDHCCVRAGSCFDECGDREWRARLADDTRIRPGIRRESDCRVQGVALNG